MRNKEPNNSFDNVQADPYDREGTAMLVYGKAIVAIALVVMGTSCAMETPIPVNDIILFLTDSPDEIGMCEPCGPCSFEECRTTPEQEEAWQRHLRLVGDEPVYFPEEFDEFEAPARGGR